MGGLWRGVVPPFRTLDPALGRAEALFGGGLPGGGGLLAGLCAALPGDEPLAAARLNALLAGLGAVPRLVYRRERWGLVVSAGDGRGDRDAEAACALAALVAATGWGRLKRCHRCGCPFLDRTAAASRLGCDRHLARTPGARRIGPTIA
jgi:hypothetical protein